MKTIEMSDILVEVKSIGLFGEGQFIRFKHKPTCVSVSMSFRMNERSPASVQIELLQKLTQMVFESQGEL